MIELEIQIANMYTKEEVQEQEASLARALDEASQRVQELETTIQNIMFDTASDGKVQALLSQVADYSGPVLGPVSEFLRV